MPTKDELKMLQSLPLDVKVAKTKQRIREWVDYYGVDGVYVSFSGGKDSTVLLHLVRELYPRVEAVFVNTGLEYPEIQQFAKSFDNVTVLRPKMRFDEVIKQYGYPIISKEVCQNIAESKLNPTSRAHSKFDNNSDYCKKYGDRFCLAKWQPLLHVDFNTSHKCCLVTKKQPAKDFEKQSASILRIYTSRENLIRIQLSGNSG